MKTYKSLVAAFYVSVRDGEHVDACYLKDKGLFSDKVVSFENILTDRFANSTWNMLRDENGEKIKFTTVERYLRKFRAIDRANLSLDRPLASASRLNAIG